MLLAGYVSLVTITQSTGIKNMNAYLAPEPLPIGFRYYAVNQERFSISKSCVSVLKGVSQ